MVQYSFFFSSSNYFEDVYEDLNDVEVDGEGAEDVFLGID